MGSLGVEGPLHDAKRRADGPIGVGLRDVSGVGHGPQHEVSALGGALGVHEGGEQRRRLNDPSEQGGLADGEVRDILAEEQPGRFRDAVHRERSALSEIHVVQIQLEDLVLRRPPLEHDRHDLLAQLPQNRPPPGNLLGCDLVGQEEIPGQLLRDRAAAFEITPIAEEVGEEGAYHADEIDTPVVVEAAVLDGQHGLDDMRRQGRQGHRSPLFPLGHVRAEERRVDHEPLADGLPQTQLFHVVRGLGWRHRLRRGFAGCGRPLKGHAHRLTLELGRARQDRDNAGTDGELADLLGLGPLCIPEVVQPVHQLPAGHRLAASQFQRSGEDVREHPLTLAVEPGVNQQGEASVVEARKKARNGHRQARDCRNHPDPSPVPEGGQAGFEPVQLWPPFREIRWRQPSDVRVQ